MKRDGNWKEKIYFGRRLDGKGGLKFLRYYATITLMRMKK
jgi:hypothetical protein